MSNGKGLTKLATIVGVVCLSSAVADIARGALIALNKHAKEAWARAEANAKKE